MGTQKFNNKQELINDSSLTVYEATNKLICGDKNAPHEGIVRELIVSINELISLINEQQPKSIFNKFKLIAETVMFNNDSCSYEEELLSKLEIARNKLKCCMKCIIPTNYWENECSSCNNCLYGTYVVKTYLDPNRNNEFIRVHECDPNIIDTAIFPELKFIISANGDKSMCGVIEGEYTTISGAVQQVDQEDISALLQQIE